MEPNQNKSNEAFKLKKFLDTQADQLNEKFKLLFFFSLNFEANKKEEQNEKERKWLNKKRIKEVHLSDLKLSV